MTSQSQENTAVSQAQEIFDAVWADILKDRDPSSIHFPKKIYWLNGAPGAGKGTQTDFLRTHLGLKTAPVIISELLNTPEAQKVKDSGLLVGDKEVFALLLKKLLEPQFADAALVDGYPRTLIQLETLKALMHKISQSCQHEFHFVVLFISEEESVKRQLTRGQKALEQNQKNQTAGINQVEEVRKTDLEESGARKRYRVYKELTYDTLEAAKDLFPYHSIDASGSIEDVQANITKALS